MYVRINGMAGNCWILLGAMGFTSRGQIKNALVASSCCPFSAPAICDIKIHCTHLCRMALVAQRRLNDVPYGHGDDDADVRN